MDIMNNAGSGKTISEASILKENRKNIQLVIAFSIVTLLGAALFGYCILYVEWIGKMPMYFGVIFSVSVCFFCFVGAAKLHRQHKKIESLSKGGEVALDDIAGSEWIGLDKVLQNAQQI